MFLALATLLAQAINNTITSIVPLQLRKEINSGLLAGILNGCCYVGSTISGYGLGALVEGNGGNWNVTFWLLIALCIATVIISAVFLLVSFIRGSAQTND